MYDVWVNWFEKAEEGYEICPFHEWRKSDQIELLEQVPILYITEALYDYIENSMGELPSELLEKIHKRTFISKGPMRERIEYAAIITDGRGIMLFHTMGNKVPTRKSRMIPRQEGQVYDICKGRDYLSFSEEKKLNPKQVEETRLKETLMHGVTRQERYVKQLLLNALYELKSTKNRSEVIYWLTEWDATLVATLGAEATVHDVWDTLYESIKYGWGERHEQFCSQFVKRDKQLETYWKLAQIKK